MTTTSTTTASAPRQQSKSDPLFPLLEDQRPIADSLLWKPPLDDEVAIEYPLIGWLFDQVASATGQVAILEVGEPLHDEFCGKVLETITTDDLVNEWALDDVWPPFHADSPLKALADYFFRVYVRRLWRGVVGDGCWIGGRRG